MKQKFLTPNRKIMNSQNTTNNNSSIVVSSFLFFSLSASMAFVAPVKAPAEQYNPSLTSLQNRMLEKPLSSNTSFGDEIIKKYGLVRLWPLNSFKNLTEDKILGNALFNTSFRVSPLYCGDSIYAKFDNKAMIKSDESIFLLNYFSENKPSQLDADLFKVKKGLTKLSEWFPNYIPTLSSDKKNNLKSNLVEKYKDKIQYSSSMVSPEKKENQYYLKDTDYTVGGWFKPQRFDNNGFAEQRMTLLTKKFTNLNGTNVVKEWEIFMSGNVIFFHNFRDYSQPVAIKYLTTEQADVFRIKNQKFYGMYDYYDDVIERRQYSNFIDKTFLPPILPKEKTTLRKPIPIINPTPITPPVTPGNPIVIPQPVPPAIIVNPSTGKEYTSNIDLKTFWWATTLGNCYSCQTPDKHSDIWHYISFSVHLNDPLGPYVDFWIIMDPNPAYFKSSATFLSHAKHLRWELDKQILSLPVLNPFKNGIEIERDCSNTSPEDFKKGTCLKSVLEIGSIEPGQAYSGYMRGIYLSKKALREKEVLDLAAEYYPNDSTSFCTYNHSPRN